MRNVRLPIYCVTVLLASIGVEALAVDFERDVYSVFKKHCFECHGSKKQLSGLRLDQRAAAKRGGDSGPVWKKSSKKSELIRRLRLPSNHDEAMPPKGKPRLKKKQIAAIANWIDSGAKWPDKAPGTKATSKKKQPPRPRLVGHPKFIVYKKTVLPFLRYYCYDCHHTKNRSAGFDVYSAAEQEFNDELASWNQAWEKISRSIVSGAMPHAKQKRQPSQAERELFGKWFEQELERRATVKTSRPSNARLRQLTAREYDNTVRDLTGLDLQHSRVVFPGGTPNDGGFLNRGHEMVLSPSRLMRYLHAADKIAAHATVSRKGIVWSKSPTVRDANPRKSPKKQTQPGKSADKDEVYVQEQLILTVRLFFRGNLIRGELSEPTHPHVIIESRAHYWSTNYGTT